ncbi:hypothetical protein ABVK25_010355 [Lepraria finkii]|uniref:Uncharacterized protein n=1 Tax=Lepraria finkii TaxID=1340010 RepID=A0ABR4AV30_9LECA
MEPEIAVQWASLLAVCEGLIAFDAVLCRQHNNVLAHPEVGHVSTRSAETIYDARPALATISLSGCQKCGSSPEGPACPGKSPEFQLPLLAPPHIHSSSVKAAQRLGTNGLPHPQFIARCRQCLKDRWCERCNAWWCESCYTTPKRRVLSTSTLTATDKENVRESIKAGAEKHCYECGQQCRQCVQLTQRRCSTCREQYCGEHDSGCDATNCAWCATGGRRTAMLDY